MMAFDAGTGIKDFILLTLAGLIVFSLSLIALYQWDKHHVENKVITQLQVEVYRRDREIERFIMVAEELKQVYCGPENKSKGGRR